MEIIRHTWLNWRAPSLGTEKDSPGAISVPISTLIISLCFFISDWIYSPQIEDMLLYDK